MQTFKMEANGRWIIQQTNIRKEGRSHLPLYYDKKNMNRMEVNRKKNMFSNYRTKNTEKMYKNNNNAKITWDFCSITLLRISCSLWPYHFRRWCTGKWRSKVAILLLSLLYLLVFIFNIKYRIVFFEQLLKT